MSSVVNLDLTDPNHSRSRSQSKVVLDGVQCCGAGAGRSRYFLVGAGAGAGDGAGVKM